MGFYYETASPTGKADAIIRDTGATEYKALLPFEMVPPGMVQLVVIENAHFDAALILDNKKQHDMYQADIEYEEGAARARVDSKIPKELQEKLPPGAVAKVIAQLVRPRRYLLVMVEYVLQFLPKGVTT